MKKCILVFTGVFTVALTSVFSLGAYSAENGPIEAVDSTIGRMMEILKGANEQQKIADLCALVKADLDNAVIGTNLLGSFQSLTSDAEGVSRFKATVPSIIMDQFYDLLHDKGGSPYSVLGTVPKGSNKIGVKVNIGGSMFVVTLLRASNKIVDVEWNNYSLVNTKRDEFQRELAGYHTDKPVTTLVERLDQNGVNKCN